MNDCCIIKENRRLVNELIEAKKYIKELEIEIKRLKPKADLEELFDYSVFDFDLD
ncbi:hypothetical protein QYB58_000720 [Clostridium perfringens]|nr:hypothetical protein [Clostridium perfringens]